MTGLCTTNGFMLGLKGVPDYNYVIEASANLFNWVSIVTDNHHFSSRILAGRPFPPALLSRQAFLMKPGVCFAGAALTPLVSVTSLTPISCHLAS
jgi:hypothetical protein